VKHRTTLYFGWGSFLFFMLFSCYIYYQHLFYPGYVEWMEGDVLRHIERAWHGLPIYPDFNTGFVSLCYMPLYYLVSAPFYAVFGDSFIGPRMVSILSALLSGIIVFLITKRETGSKKYAALAGALYFSSFRIMDAWITSCMPDSLMMLFIMAGLYFFTYSKSRIGDVFWIMLFSLSFWSKQQGALFFGCAVLYALWTRKNYLPKWGILLGIFIGGPVLYFTIGRIFGNNFYFYTYTLPHNWEHSIWFAVRRTALILGCFIPFGGILSIVYLLETSNWKKLEFTPIGFFLLASILVTTMTETSAGASNNHYIPFIAITCITAVLGAKHIIEDQKKKYLFLFLLVGLVISSAVTIVSLLQYGNLHPIPKHVPFVFLSVIFIWVLLRKMKRSHEKELFAITLIAAQMAAAFYSPQHYIAHREFDAALRNFRMELSKLEGPAIWIDYGNAPITLTGIKLYQVPSWVPMEDLDRQATQKQQGTTNWKDILKELYGIDDFYILSNVKIENVPAKIGKNVMLVKEYKDEFIGIRQICDHWYEGKSYPRYLYHTTRES
jgi:4-amino-4-deoxy-L-arabinose transferase-like glycosyltransferase